MMLFQSTFTQEMADRICELTAEGNSLRQIEKLIGIKAQTICGWIIDNKEFGEQYARAVNAKTETMMDDLIDLATKTDITLDGKAYVDNKRLIIDTMKWTIAKKLPKKYGIYAQQVKNDNNENADVEI